MERESRLPLEGIKVLDFGRLINVPMAAKYLGDYGATVVEIESPTHNSRSMFPFAGGIPGINRSGLYAAYNSSKYNITLDFNHAGALDLVKRLIVWSDVVVENNVPGVMKRWGISYDDVKKMKPDVIMLSSTTLGQEGPYRMQKSTGELLPAYAGFTNLTGWPDRLPVGQPNAYTDFITPFYIITAIMGALSYRKKNGKGIYIDLSQIEASIAQLSHVVLEYTANGKIRGATGNRCQYAAPHGAYRCKGNDRWCTIAVFTDEAWRSFCKVIGDPEWTKDIKFTTLLSRKENEDELDRLVEQWTSRYHAEEVMEKMQQAGIAAGVVQNSEDISKDPQLKSRNHFVVLEQPEMGQYAHENSSFILSKTPARIRPAPCFGEHNEYICKQFLGMSDEEFVRLFNEGIFTSLDIERNHD
jgi:benzylsuccinate CoA-transferase BbsF subunit